MERFVLASASPRRRELLSEIIDEFLVVPADINEDVYNILPPQEMVELLSKKKAEKVANRYFDRFVIGADTIVVKDNKVFGKPKDLEDARKMLLELSGNTHTVITGVTLIHKQKNIIDTFSEITDVTFFELSNEILDKWLKNFYFMDKAGAYAIQGMSKIFVESISGDFYNVVGFPVARFYQRYKNFIRN